MNIFIFFQFIRGVRLRKQFLGNFPKMLVFDESFLQLNPDEKKERKATTLQEKSTDQTF